MDHWKVKSSEPNRARVEQKQTLCYASIPSYTQVYLNVNFNCSSTEISARDIPNTSFDASLSAPPAIISLPRDGVKIGCEALAWAMEPEFLVHDGEVQSFVSLKEGSRSYM